MKLRNLLIFTIALWFSTTAHGVINFTTNTTDLLEGSFQIDLTTQEANLGPVMAELNAIEFDGGGSLMQAIVQFNFEGDQTPVEYFQIPNEDPALVASGSETGTFTALQTGGRAINYSYTNVLTDSLTISGDFSFTGVPEPGTYGALAGIAALGMVVYRRRRV